MAAKRYDPSKKYAAHLPLKAWFERVSRDANLCLSLAHILELVPWPDQETADTMARWYDTMPIIWVRSIQDITQEFEPEYWTKIAAGVEVDPGMKPFAGSLLTSFHAPSPDGVSAFLAESEPSLAALRELRGSSAWRTRFEGYQNGVIEMLMGVLRNHLWADAQGWSEVRKQGETLVNIRRALWEGAVETDRRLTSRGDSAWGKKQRTLREIQAGLLDVYERDLASMPLMRVTDRFKEGAVARVERGQVVDGRPSKRLREDLVGSFGDWLHLVGAAYCDVFTCDGDVSTWLGDVRETLGFRRQLSERNHPSGAEGFVRDLMATVP